MKKLIAFVAVLIGLLQYRLWFGDGGITELQALNSRIAELKQEGERRRERNAALKADIRDLKEGSDSIEERARRELGMVREGETFIQVFEAPHSEPESAKAPATGGIAPKRLRKGREQ